MTERYNITETKIHFSKNDVLLKILVVDFTAKNYTLYMNMETNYNI